MLKFLSIAALLLVSNAANCQIDQGKVGAWYIYFFDQQIKERPWGFQGDLQLRNWNLGGDLEQLLLRGGLTYSPKNAKIKFTLGYADVTSGTFGDLKTTSRESRIYQEALFPQKIGERFYLTHRMRYEQRFVQGQDFRTRYRYNLFLNIPLNSKEMKKNTVYLALYDEIFINGERNIGNGTTVEIFDRNRFYTAIGFIPWENLKIQFGLMNQTTNGWKKNQLQLSLHHKF